MQRCQICLTSSKSAQVTFEENKSVLQIINIDISFMLDQNNAFNGTVVNWALSTLNCTAVTWSTLTEDLVAFSGQSN